MHLQLTNQKKKKNEAETTICYLYLVPQPKNKNHVLIYKIAYPKNLWNSIFHSIRVHHHKSCNEKHDFLSTENSIITRNSEFKWILSRNIEILFITWAEKRKKKFFFFDLVFLTFIRQFQRMKWEKKIACERTCLWIILFSGCKLLDTLKDSNLHKNRIMFHSCKRRFYFFHFFKTLGIDSRQMSNHVQ